MSDELVEDKILRAKLLRDMGLSTWQLKDLFDKMDMIQEQLSKMQLFSDNLSHIMNLRTNALRNDLDDLKATVYSLDEMIDRDY